MRNQSSTLKQECENHCVTNCSAHKLSSIDTVPCLTLSNGVNNRTRYIFALIREMWAELFSPGQVEKL